MSYHHKTSCELTFDKIRALQYECDNLRAYILACASLNEDGSNSCEKICDALYHVSGILFDDVYKPIREIWH